MTLDVDEMSQGAPRAPGKRTPEPAITDAGGAPAFAADGTDLTVIRWMLALSPADRIRWLQSHVAAVATIRRDQPRP